MTDPGSRQAVEIAERYADGLATRKELTDAHDDAWRAWKSLARSDNSGIGGHAAIFEAGRAAIESAARAATVARHVRDGDFWQGWAAEQAEQCKLLRDILGNPFRPITLDPAILTWNNRLVIRLGQAAYDHRELPSGTLDNTRLAVLADALEETGCTDAESLGHLQEPGPHVRGCWVVDLCLGIGSS
jgi:hypothetical protein